MPRNGEFLGTLLTVETNDERIRELEQMLDWIRQTIHRAHHDGPMDKCKLNTCDAILKVLGKR